MTADCFTEGGDWQGVFDLDGRDTFPLRHRECPERSTGQKDIGTATVETAYDLAVRDSARDGGPRSRRAGARLLPHEVPPWLHLAPSSPRAEAAAVTFPDRDDRSRDRNGPKPNEQRPAPAVA